MSWKMIVCPDCNKRSLLCTCPETVMVSHNQEVINNLAKVLALIVFECEDTPASLAEAALGIIKIRAKEALANLE